MRETKDRTYRTREFARMAGVTVRALHHYDRLGLLKPRRTRAGYRAYSTRDLESLEQIIALKFIGVPLKEIAVLRHATGPQLANALRAQRITLEEKRSLLDRAIEAIRQVEFALQSGKPAESVQLTQIIEAIEMQQNGAQWKKTYDKLVQAKIERLKSMSPEVRSELRSQWTALLKDVEGALSEDPASPKAQDLAARWVKLLEVFAGEPLDGDLVQKFGAAYQRPDAKIAAGVAPMGDQRVWDFMGTALAVRRQA